MKIKVKPEQKLDFLSSFLNDHWEDHRSVDKAFYDYVYQSYPEFRYSGRAHRAIFNQEGSYKDQMNLNAYTCWSRSQLGMINFLNHEIIDQAFLEGDEVFILEAEVDGIDLVKIAQLLLKEGVINGQQAQMFFLEEEVINMNTVSSAKQKKYGFADINKAIQDILKST
jgi:hypothetical protein